MNLTMGAAKFTFSLNVFRRLCFVDIWDVRFRLGMMKFSPEYTRCNVCNCDSIMSKSVAVNFQKSQEQVK